MIYNSGLESVIEAIYLDEKLVPKIGKANIEVNPSEASYAVGKTIILTNNKCTNVDILIRNGNKVISRVKGYGDDVQFQPYIIRPNFNIFWNGEVYECPREFSGDLDDIMEWLGAQDKFPVNYDEKVSLCFPKVTGILKDVLVGPEGNLTSLGWLLHQVGVNVGKTFLDMDLLKTKKIIKR